MPVLGWGFQEVQPEAMPQGSSVSKKVVVLSLDIFLLESQGSQEGQGAEGQRKKLKTKV